MYKKFFGFKTEPFNITPDPDLFYCSIHLQEIIDTIIYQLEKRRGFLIITGDVGTGKTLLCRTLINKLLNYNISLVLNPFLDETEILHYICKDFGILKEEKKYNKGELFHLLTEFLVESYKKGKNSLIIVDEAQNLSFEAFEMIRQISNIELEDAKLVQIIFSGQKELIDKINSYKLRQLRQRISIILELKPFNIDDTRNYINFRVYETLHYKKNIFTESAIKKIYKFTKGIPREINQLAEMSLIAAFSNNHKMVNKKDVNIAAKEYYRIKNNKKEEDKLLMILSILGLILIVMLIILNNNKILLLLKELLNKLI